MGLLEMLMYDTFVHLELILINTFKQCSEWLVFSEVLSYS